MSPLRASRWIPWSALVSGLSGEAVHHQLLSDLLRFRCEWGRPAVGFAVTLAVMLWMATGCLLSRSALDARVLEGLAPSVARNRRFIVHLGWGVCAVLSVAVLWQMLAVLWMPPCPTP